MLMLMANASPLIHEPSTLIQTVQTYQADLGAVNRKFPNLNSNRRNKALDSLFKNWSTQLDAINFEKLNLESKVDWILLKNEVAARLHGQDLEAKRYAEIADLVPFADEILDMEDRRRVFEWVEPKEVAAKLERLSDQIEKLIPQIGDSIKSSRTLAYRATKQIDVLQEALQSFTRFYTGYDPMFTWWASKPAERLAKALGSYEETIRAKLVGTDEKDSLTIIGDPVGRDGLLADLRAAMIGYTPEQLLKIGEKEYAWCEAEMKKASREMGFGDDWKKALEKVKTLYVEPGKQPELIREQAVEAIDFLEKKDLITVPELAKSTWRMEMMPPEAQKVSPFFLGGEQILVSFPTDGMEESEKLMSLRANNRYFARATVQHELIPGHHLQFFMLSRYNPYRELFGTPFWIEGWALYWEMLLWDEGFAPEPEQRVGMLFWRMHRCARIVFSLKFHLGEWTPQQCIHYLVDKVGHERNSAEGEVRRSFKGDYPPLYQLAYMIGGLQFRELYREVVASGKMTAKAFHDQILKEHEMPVAMVRALLTGKAPAKNFKPDWKFYPGLD
ncbi:MAG: DUF885 family protein [Armatimonadetes bacterium]|nr:DUF885 family protein [Armatimonadota bacterium]